MPKTTKPQIDLPEFIDTEADLKKLCTYLRTQSRIAVDTEFVAERTYYPVLGVVQVGTEESCHVIDTIAIENLSSLNGILKNKEIVKIFHAGKQDFGILYEIVGDVPEPIFDTQVAAAFVGYGEQVSYAKLVERVLHVPLSKHSGLTDWTKRPLTSKQMSYALDDVRYLPELYDHLVERLHQMKRTTWCHEELKNLANPEQYVRPEPREMYRNVKRWSTLNRQGLTVLRELAAWREDEARTRNRPRSRIISDDLLVEIAKMAPQSEKALGRLRPLNPRERSRSGAEIVEAVKRAADCPEDERPCLPPRQHAKSNDIPGLVELLTSYLRCRSEALQIAPRFVSTRDELERLAKFYGTKSLVTDPKKQECPPVLRGWRRKLIGEDFLEILDGRCGVTVDRESGRLRLISNGKPE